MPVVGFDFGTTNSSISVIVGGRPIDILDPANGLPFPSVVRYEGEATTVGRAAKETLEASGIGVHGNVVLSPKFLLGDETVTVGGVERSPVDIVRDVVLHVKSEALRGPLADELDGVSSAVVTIPVIFNGPQRAALRDAFRRADIDIVQFVHEPLAALYGYFRSQSDVASTLREYQRRTILVVDWGGGTLDLTLCRLEGDRILQMRNGGSQDVGGDRFDEAIRNTVIRDFCSESGIGDDAEIHPDARIRLLRDAEANKIELSTRSAVTFYRQGFFRDRETPLEHQLTRESLDSITRPLVQQGLKQITSLLESAQVGTSQIAMCLVTGGMAAMPAIIGRIHEMFGPHRVHVPSNTGTSIAQGAAWIAHDRQRLRLAKKIEVQLARGAFLPIVQEGTEMPSHREVKSDTFQLYCADPRDGSAKFVICTPAGLAETVQTSDPRLPLGTLVLQVDRNAQPFRERLDLDVSIDDDLILKVRAASSDVKDERRHEFHDLEFAVSIPDGLGNAPSPEGQNSGDLNVAPEHKSGDLVVRSNIADQPDDYLVPGELLHTYKPRYFEKGIHPPKVQVEEYLYYQPCAVCGRASSDPACRCASSGGRR